MGYAELTGRYQALRTELDAAYAVWNSSAIDEIADQIAEVERALASVQHVALQRGAGGGDRFGAGVRS